MRCFVIAVIATMSTLASADPGAEAKDLNERGIKLFRAQKDAEALELFERAFALDAKPSYLFNLALAAEQVGECPKAQAAFIRYTQIAPVEESTAKQRAEAKKRAASLGETCEPSKGLYEPGPGETVAEMKGKPAAGDPEAKPDPEPWVRADSSTEPDRQRLWLYGTIGGATATVGMIALHIYARRRIAALNDDLEALPVDVGSTLCSGSDLDSRVKTICDRGDRAALVGNISTIAGAAFLGGTLFAGYMAFFHQPKAEQNRGIQATLGGPGDVGMTVFMSF